MTTTLDTLAVSRLLKLADLLENEITDAQFDMDVWKQKKKKGNVPCKTVGCACGWAADSTKFRDFVLVKDDAYTDGAGILRQDFFLRNREDQSEGLSAARSYFRLPPREDYDIDDAGNFLFLPEQYAVTPTRRRVIKRIRTYVANDGDIEATRKAA